MVRLLYIAINIYIIRKTINLQFKIKVNFMDLIVSAGLINTAISLSNIKIKFVGIFRTTVLNSNTYYVASNFDLKN